LITSRLKIVHVFRAPLGGLFRHVVDLATEQSARGHQVGLFFDAGGRDARVDEILSAVPNGLALGVGMAPIGRGPAPSDLISLARFRKWLIGIAPDVVHGHGAKGGVLARLAGHGRSEAIVAYTPHGGSFNYRSGTFAHWLYMRVEAALARSTDLFLFESDYIAGRFEACVGAPRGLLRRAYNGVRPQEFAEVEIAPGASDWLYIGELRGAKGVDTLLEALALLSRRGGAAPTLGLVGSGPDREAFERRAKDLGIEPQVRFHGPLPARKAFALGRVLVVPSRQESLPYIVLEAAAARKPIVATSVGGIPEIFGPSSARLIAPDDPQILADALAAKRAQDERQRAEEASVLQAYVSARFSISGLADAVLTGYADALKRRRSFEADAAVRLHPRA
jgi:glycosyltransferase involved in cell wall biosynthesis